MAISFSGLTTGIDSAALIKALVEAKRQPITVLQNQASDYQSRLTKIDEFTSKLTTLRSAVLSLSSASSFSSFGAASSDSSVISVAASSAASEGNHIVTVQQLAKSQVTRSTQTFTETDTAAGLSGTLTLTPTGGAVNGPSSTVTINASDTLEEIRDNINNATSTSYGTITFRDGAVPDDGTTLTVDGVTYEFTTGTASGANVKVDTTGLTTGAQLASALAAAATGAGKGALSTMTANGASVLVTADAAGSAGNAIAMSKTGAGANDLALSGDTLAGGGGLMYAASLINTGTPSSPAYSLILTGRASGTANTFSASFAGTGSLTFANTQGAQNAILTVDGMSGIERSSNVVTDVIQGVTMTLITDTVAPNPTTPISITVSRNSEDITAKVRSFISAYNDLKTYINANTKFDPVSKTGGPLMGENTVSIVSDRLAGLLVNAVSGLTGSYSALSRVGVKTQSDGTLALDETKFDAAMSADFRGVVDLFARNYTTGTQGVAYAIQTQIDKWMSTVDGLIPNRKSAIQDNIRHINEQVDQKESAVTLYEQALKVQYANLEALVSRLQSQTGALNSLSGLLK